MANALVRKAVDFSESDDAARDWTLSRTNTLRERLEDKAAAKRVATGAGGLADYLRTAARVPGQLLTNLADSAVSGLTLPGDVAAGKTPVPLVPSSDPEALNELVKRALDLTGTIGSATLAAPRGAIGAGAVLPEKATVKAATVEPFYSHLERVVSKGPASASPQQWLATLKNNGVRGEELDWTGVEKALAGKTGPMSREELLGMARGAKPEIKEVVKGSGFGNLADHLVVEPDGGRFRVVNRANDSVVETAPTRAEAERIRQEIIDHPEDEPDGGVNMQDTKFSQYQLPGGENYREVLLTMPEKGKGGLARYEELNDIAGRRNLTDAEQSEMVALERSLGRQDSQTTGANFQSSHWDEPNVLVHMRLNDRDIGGRKTLFAEEIQSDWHQKGRKEGYKTPDVEQRLQQVRDEIERIEDAREVGDRPSAQLLQLRTEREALKKQAGTGVPDAPFKKTWPDLALKRIVREAAEKGYDQVAWTDGATQADRYDLSKHIDAIGYQKRGDLFNVTVWDRKGAQVLNNQSADLKWVEDHLGKEMAEKMSKGVDSGPPQPHGVQSSAKFKYLTDLDLKVGGEGMKGFYDRILPAQANKLFGKYGTKVEQQELPYGLKEAQQATQYPDPNKGKMVHVLPITPELRRAALSEGFPLFSSGAPLPVSSPNPAVDRSHDVPYLAGSSAEGGKTYIDRSVPPSITQKSGKTYDPARYLTVHEQLEHDLMAKGQPYESAHRAALDAERAAVLRDGLDWDEYQSAMKALWSKTEKNTHPTSPPPDLYTKPYPHDEAQFLQRQGRRAIRLTPVAHVPTFPDAASRAIILPGRAREQRREDTGR